MYIMYAFVTAVFLSYHDGISFIFKFPRAR